MEELGNTGEVEPKLCVSGVGSEGECYLLARCRGVTPSISGRLRLAPL